MRKLALDDEILLSIEKPARYIGNEVNSIMKNKNEVDIRFAMCFPDVYEIGMSHLGIQILYDMFNRRDDVWCERVYSPWTDLDTIMRKEGIPLFALESQDPIREFDFLGITIQFEIVFVALICIYMWVRAWNQSEQAQANTMIRITDTEGDKIKKIALNIENGELNFEKENGVWYDALDHDIPINQSIMNEIADTVGSISANRNLWRDFLNFPHFSKLVEPFMMK